MKLYEMDEKMRRLARAAASGDEHEAVRLLRSRMRSGEVSEGTVNALAVLGHTGAQRLTDVAPAGDMEARIALALTYSDLSDAEIVSYALDCAEWAYPVFGNTPVDWRGHEEQAEDEGWESDQERVSNNLDQMREQISRARRGTGSLSREVFNRAWSDAEPAANSADDAAGGSYNVYDPDPNYKPSESYYAIWAMGAAGMAGFYASGGNTMSGGFGTPEATNEGRTSTIEAAGRAAASASRAHGNEPWPVPHLIRILTNTVPPYLPLREGKFYEAI